MKYIENIIKDENYLFDNDYFITNINKIRNEIINDSLEYIYKIKSPFFHERIYINNIPISYSYERNITHKTIENNYKRRQLQDIDCLNENIVFNSGISSIFNVLTMLKRIINKDNISVIKQYSYFETSMIMKVLNIDENELSEYNFALDSESIYFIESIRYDETFEYTNLELLLSKICSNRKNSLKPVFIVIDSTLYRDEEFFKEISKKLHDGIFIIEIISLLKLHQFGMEISNLGIVSLYSNNSGKYVLTSMRDYLKKLRNLSGANLNSYEISAISNELFFDKKMTCIYKNKIYENAKIFSNLIKEGNIFKGAAYPKDGDSPIVILKTKKLVLDEYKLILSILDYETKKRKIKINIGSSFGFNHTRYELIIKDKVKEICFFKIAIGAFDVDEQLKFAQLINEINVFDLDKYKSYKCFKIIDFGDDYE